MIHGLCADDVVVWEGDHVDIVLETPFNVYGKNYRRMKVNISDGYYIELILGSLIDKVLVSL